MAVTYKILGQQTANNTWATLYGTPAGKSAVISTIVICNIAASSKTFSIGVMSTEGTPGTSQLLASGTTVPANDTIIMTLGITMEAARYIRVFGQDANIGFSAFGSEIT